VIVVLLGPIRTFAKTTLKTGLIVS